MAHAALSDLEHGDDKKDTASKGTCGWEVQMDTCSLPLDEDSIQASSKGTAQKGLSTRSLAPPPSPGSDDDPPSSAPGFTSSAGNMLSRVASSFLSFSTSVLAQASMSIEPPSGSKTTSPSAPSEPPSGGHLLSPAVDMIRLSFADTDESALLNEDRYVNDGNPSWSSSARVIRFRGSSCSYDSTTPRAHFQTASTESNIPFSLNGSLAALKKALAAKNASDIPQDDHAAVDEALSSVVRLVQHSADRQAVVGRMGGCALVCQVVEAYMDAAIICESGLQAIYWLGLCDANRSRLVKARAMHLVVDAAQQYVGVEMLAELACKAMSCLAVTESNRSVLVEVGALKALEEILGQHATSSESVVEWACRAIYSLMTEHPENRKATQDTALCSLLVGAGLKNTVLHSPDIIRWGCRAVGNVAFQCDVTQRLLGDVGACEAVVAILKKFGEEDGTIAESACWAAGSLGYPNGRNQLKLLEEGIGPLLQQMLQTHMKSPEVTEQTCIAIRNLVLDNDTCQETIGSATTICRVLISINSKYEQQHHQNQKWARIDDIVHWAWFAIASLCRHPQNRLRFVDCDVGVAMVNILKRSSAETEKTCRWVCSSLSRLVEDESIAKGLGNIGISRSIVVAANKFTGNPYICTCLCKAVGFMAGNSENRIWLGAAGVCEAVVAVMEANRRSRYVTEQALWAVANMVQIMM